MTTRLYVPWPNRRETPNETHQAIIDWANHICAELKAQGYNLTLRQLYYQFISRDLLPNNQRSYDLVGRVVNDARLAGLIDWSYLEDRTRNLQGYPYSPTVEDFIANQVRSYHVDRWQDQEERVEVWVEKEALVDVVGRAALVLDVDYFACKGYVSQSEMYAAAQRHRQYERAGQRVRVLHLGDHDPSGMDMTRDIQDRLFTFEVDTDVRRIALNMDQIDQYQPAPNWAKLSDGRAKKYIAEYGTKSWELDSLSPAVMDALIQAEIEQFITDLDAFEARRLQQEKERELLTEVSARWDDVKELLS